MLLQRNLNPAQHSLRTQLFEDIVTFCYGYNHPNQDKLHAYFHELSSCPVFRKKGKELVPCYAVPQWSVDEVLSKTIDRLFEGNPFEVLMGVDILASIKEERVCFVDGVLMDPFRKYPTYEFSHPKCSYKAFKQDEIPKTVFGALLNAIFIYQQAVSKIYWNKTLWSLIPSSQIQGQELVRSFDSAQLYQKAQEALFYVLSFAQMHGDQKVINRVMKCVMASHFVSETGTNFSLMQHFEEDRKQASFYISHYETDFREELTKLYEDL